MFFQIWDKILEKTHAPKSPLGLPPNRALMDATDTFFRKPAIVTKRAPHIRDATDLKRFMITVVIALVPCLLWGVYNTGRNAYLSVGVEDPGVVAAFLEGAVWVLPLLVLTYLVGGFWEGLFAQLRGHEVSEGFLVSGMLYTLIVPPTLPWWQAALGISFGVVIGKEVFGGVGMNILNPALTARAFLFFAYPAQLSGNVWVATPVVKGSDGMLARYWQTTVPQQHIDAFIAGKELAVDGYSGATALAVAAENVPGVDSVVAAHQLYSATDMFLGLIPGSIGETSTLMVLLGALVLIATGVGSWRTIVSVFVGGFVTASLFSMGAGPGSPSFWTLPPHEHLIMGGFAFGAVFMATDPVTAPFHKTSKFIYGFLIGALCILIRVINPAYPEGMMLAILFMNVFAPLIDHYVVSASLKRRAANAAG
ncbi:MAG: NADH:ubiquinone reductase (Na(+)-transporting) subunit B [Myxococcota bacterium]